MDKHVENFFLQGAGGQIECLLLLPEMSVTAIALVGHPHPLYGGTINNKVTQTLLRTFVRLGFAAATLNFRGAGQSTGTHDNGIGETDDMEILLQALEARFPELPKILSGFSFGTFVQSRLAARLAARGQSIRKLVLVGAAAGKWAMPNIPANTLLIHGELDDTIPLVDVMSWLRPQNIPICVIPGADHFFHRKLDHIRNLVSSACQGDALLRN